MAGFESYETSLKMRDVIDRMVEEKITSLRPAYRMATVTSIDRANRKCSVLYTGAPAPVQVNMGAIQPMEEGQTVRIEGIGSDRFIADVMGKPYIEGAVMRNVATDTPVEDGFDKIFIGDPTIDYPAELWIERLRGTSAHAAILCVPASEGGTGEVGLISRVDGTNRSRFRLFESGQIGVQTYENSSSPTQTIRRLPFAMATGSANFSLSSEGVKTAAITFPSGMFSAAPEIWLTQRSLPGGSGTLIPKYSSSGLSASGATLYVYTGTSENVTTTNLAIGWLAIQMAA